MASQSIPQPQTEKKEQQYKLKYLEFVQVAILHLLMRCATVYAYTMERSGSLRPCIRSVEESVKSVVAPVYDKFHLVPDEILRYADGKLDRSVTAAHGAPAAARTTAKNIYEKFEPAAKDLYERYEAKAEQCAVAAWRWLNQFPVFPRVANVVVPKAAYWTDKYNETVVAAAEKGYRASAYLPLVPTERIAKVFSD